MKKVLIIFIILISILVVFLIFVKKFSSNLIFVSPPIGNPIGEVEIPKEENSVLSLNVEVPINVLEKSVNKNTPAKIKNQDTIKVHDKVKNGLITWQISRKSINLKNTGKSIAFKVPFSGVGLFTGDIDAKILTIPIKNRINLEGVIKGTVNPVILPNWNINLNLSLNTQFKKAYLNIGGLGNVDISSLLKGSINNLIQKEVQKYLPKLDETIKLREKVYEYWKKAHINKVVSKDPKLWVNIVPEKIFLSHIKYNKLDRISFDLAIKSKNTFINVPVSRSNYSKLPNLVPIKNKVTTNVSIPFIIDLKHLNNDLKSRGVDIEAGLGVKIYISDMEVRIGDKGLLNVKLNIETNKTKLGSFLKGSIWIQGKPIIDFKNQVFRLSNVDFTLETKNSLTSATNWILKDTIIKALENNLRIDVNDYQEKIRKELQKSIQSDEFPKEIDLSINDLRVTVKDLYTVTKPYIKSKSSPSLVLVVNIKIDMKTTLTSEL